MFHFIPLQYLSVNTEQGVFKYRLGNRKTGFAMYPWKSPHRSDH